jgi:hypothetical protein
MNNQPLTPTGNIPDLAKDSLSQALRNKRLNTSNKKRLVAPNDEEDQPGDLQEEPQT